jgi:molybdate transport system regulatory protein
MNRLWPRPLVNTAIGGKRGGGTQITELGREVLAAYRDMQIQLEHLLDKDLLPKNFLP